MRLLKWGSDQEKKKASKDKCKRNVEDAKKDGIDDDGDDQPLSKKGETCQI